MKILLLLLAMALDADDINGSNLPQLEEDLHFGNSSIHVKFGISLSGSGEGTVNLPACSIREI